MDDIKVHCDTIGCRLFTIKRKIADSGVTLTTVECPNCKAKYRESIEMQPAIVASKQIKEHEKFPEWKECDMCSHEPDCGYAFNDYGRCIVALA